MPKPSQKGSGPPSPPRRKSSSLIEQQRKDKGRSRNACDRCKQKKVKCDGEGVRVCSICSEGDFQCNYAQKPHDEKRQYRKGYVEMVEEANNYYKKGLHELYRKFANEDIFLGLRSRQPGSAEPTVQEIINALGVPSTDKPYEGGIKSINSYLERQGKPMLVRRGEWDREDGHPKQQQQPSPSPSDEMEMESTTEASSPSPVYSYASPVKREFDAAFADLPMSPFSPDLQLQQSDSSSIPGGTFSSAQRHLSNTSNQHWAPDSSSHSSSVPVITPLVPSRQQHQLSQLQQLQTAPNGFANFEHFFGHLQNCSPPVDQQNASDTIDSESRCIEPPQDFDHGEDVTSTLFFPQTQTGHPTVCLADLEVFNRNALSGGADLHDLMDSMDKHSHLSGTGGGWYTPSQPANVRRRTLV